MASLNACDFYGLDEFLTQEQSLARKTAKDFIAKHVSPRIKESFEAGYFLEDLPEIMGGLGLLGANLSGYGCAGMDSLSYGLIMKELERCDSGLRSFASVQTSLCMYAIHEFGSEEQKEKYLPKMAQGKIIGCFGLTEPDVGSNPEAMGTNAKKQGSHFILNGSKTWITNAPISQLAIVWAKTHEGIRGFLVEKGTPGFSIARIKNKLSLRASETGTLFFQSCKIPEENLLPKTLGLKSALSCLNQARFGISFGVLGAAEECLQEALTYTQSRVMFEKPLASFQLVQEKLVHMSTEITKANLLAFRLAQLKESKKVKPAQICMAKQNNTKIALDCARLARDLLGANGVSNDYNSMRHMCNLESVFTYEGTDHIHKLVIGQEITGFSAFF